MPEHDMQVPQVPMGRTPSAFETQCNITRKQVKEVAADLKRRLELAKKELAMRERAPGEDFGEMLANLTLAYRHLEDASSRLGKAIQASDGGVSVYDRATTVGA